MSDPGAALRRSINRQTHLPLLGRFGRIIEDLNQEADSIEPLESQEQMQCPRVLVGRTGRAEALDQEPTHLLDGQRIQRCHFFTCESSKPTSPRSASTNSVATCSMDQEQQRASSGLGIGVHVRLRC
jgi:hypothetical protein